MQRRSYLKTIMAGAAGLATANAQTKAAPKNPIVLHVDLQVDPARIDEMTKAYHTQFKPEAMKHAGYIDLKILKLRTTYQGKAPAGMNFRFQLTMESEELRQKWINSPEHQRVWPLIENTLTDKKYTVLLLDAI